MQFFLASFDYSSFYCFLSSVFNIYEWKLGLVHYIFRIVCLEIDFGLLDALSLIGSHWKQQKGIRKRYCSHSGRRDRRTLAVYTRTVVLARTHTLRACTRLAASARLFSNVPLTSCRICIHMQCVWWTVVQTEIRWFFVQTAQVRQRKYFLFANVILES